VGYATLARSQFSGINEASMQRALDEILSLANGEIYEIGELKADVTQGAFEVSVFLQKTETSKSILNFTSIPPISSVELGSSLRNIS
jgi:hypothetical protein